MKTRALLFPLLVTALLLPLCLGADKHPAISDPAKVDADYALQGEYRGGSGPNKTGLQVIALGDGTFEAVLCEGGLPGDGWNQKKPRARASGSREENRVSFTGDAFRAELDGDEVTVTVGENGEPVSLSRVVRQSPTLGASPPEGAVVLFDGSEAVHAEHWESGKFADGLLEQGASSKARFGDHQLHLEFRLPYQPKSRGQGRGNSGLYVTGRYEVQMLDSFGLTGKDNECGGIYKIAEPDQNMCFPPLTWQTYDVDFTAPRFEDGEKVANARITVKHNGVVIHDDIELPNPTGGARLKSEEGPGPIFLQNHGNPVRYRNIWVVPK